VFLLAAPFAAQAADVDWDSKIKIHGFLSQAWAKTDGEPYLGITKDGTTDYRNLALQLRFQVAEQQSLVFQLGHESRGESPRDALRDDVELDWAFYEAHVKDFSVRVGRIPLPLGIYSELRDAGHLLPFYGPPTTIYGETSYATETIDGASVNYVFFQESPWSLDADVFAGQGTISEKSRLLGTKLTDTKDEWGFRVWLNTPVEGLRLGWNHHEFETEDSVTFRNDTAQVINYASLDWTRDRWLVRSEIGTGELKLPAAGIGATVTSGYVTLGYSPLPKFWVYVEGERRNLVRKPQIAPGRRLHDSLSVSLTYAVNERVVLKLERQDLDTTDLDRPLVAGEPTPNVKATIASISVAY
jgi:hypothetical protein